MKKQISNQATWGRFVFLLATIGLAIPLQAGQAAPRAAAPQVANARTQSQPDRQVPSKDAPKDAAPAFPPALSETEDLRSLIGVNPTGLKRIEMPHMPVMSLRGFIQPHGQPPMALLEIKELDRIFLVQVGTEIPISVVGRVTPIGRAELTGLDSAPKPQAAAVDSRDQSQIILEVIRVTAEGVTVRAGLSSQTIIIR